MDFEVSVNLRAWFAKNLPNLPVVPIYSSVW